MRNYRYEEEACKTCGKTVRIIPGTFHCTKCKGPIHLGCVVQNQKIVQCEEMSFDIEKVIAKKYSVTKLGQYWVNNNKLCLKCFMDIKKEMMINIQNLTQDIANAKQLELNLKYDPAIAIYKKYEMDDQVEILKEKQSIRVFETAQNYLDDSDYQGAMAILKSYNLVDSPIYNKAMALKNEQEFEAGKERNLRLAKNYEKALKYLDAIGIYEKYELWDEAGRCRRIHLQQTTTQMRVDIGQIDQSTRINDSVIQRSNIGGKPKRRISICPYCGEDLDFPEPPRFCPYCRKQILH